MFTQPLFGVDDGEIYVDGQPELWPDRPLIAPPLTEDEIDRAPYVEEIWTLVDERDELKRRVRHLHESERDTYAGDLSEEIDAAKVRIDELNDALAWEDANGYPALDE